MQTCSKCHQNKPVAEYYKQHKTGKPYSWCKKCHNKMCSAKLREKYAANPELYKQKSHEYYRKDIEQSRAKNRAYDLTRREKKKAYREANCERIKARNAEYRQENKANIDASNKAYRKANRDVLRKRHKKWRDGNKERAKAIHRKWMVANRDTVNAATHRRRTRLNATGENYTVAEWRAVKKAQDYTCLGCKKREPEISLTIDHIVPVSKRGGNSIRNIQGLCFDCNLRKGDTTVDFRTEEMKNAVMCNECVVSQAANPRAK